MEEESIFENLKADEVEVPYWQRSCAAVFDGFIGIILILAFYFLMPAGMLSELFATAPFMKYVITIAIIFSYRIICVLLFERTLGMKVFRVKYLNRELMPLNSSDKMIAASGFRTTKLKYYKA